mmetsp:Transcript_35595/g.82766  ORF Transcript_35595/g.82766 Transcript_35595/m.82766 type:complete len:85 (+) Transcript_35595:569-823(+)
MGQFLAAGLFILFFWGLVNLIFGWHLTFLYSALGAVLFSLYIVYDTWQIANRLGCDDYIIASIELYLDIVNLFLFILSMLGRRN